MHVSILVIFGFALLLYLWLVREGISVSDGVDHLWIIRVDFLYASGTLPLHHRGHISRCD